MSFEYEKKTSVECLPHSVRVDAYHWVLLAHTTRINILVAILNCIHLSAALLKYIFITRYFLAHCTRPGE